MFLQLLSPVCKCKKMDPKFFDVCYKPKTGPPKKSTGDEEMTLIGLVLCMFAGVVALAGRIVTLSRYLL